MKLSRNDLYRLVWSMPGVAIARALGVSSAGLTKILRRNDIPAPGRGHWQRVAAGMQVQVKALVSADPERMLRFDMPPDLAHRLSELPSLGALLEAPTGHAQRETGGSEAADGEVVPVLRPMEPDKTAPKRRGRPPGASARANEPTVSRQPKSAVVEAPHRRTSTAIDRPLVSTLRPQQTDAAGQTLASLRDFAGCLAAARSTVQLLQELESQIGSQPAAVAAIARLWLDQAGRETRSIDLVEPFLDTCRVIGAADRLPAWLLPRAQDRN